MDKWTARIEVIQMDAQKSLNEHNTNLNNLATFLNTMGQRSKENREIIKQAITAWHIEHMESMEEFRKEWDELIRKQASGK